MGKWKIVLSVFALLRDSFESLSILLFFVIAVNKKKKIDFLFLKKKKAGSIASNY